MTVRRQRIRNSSLILSAVVGQLVLFVFLLPFGFGDRDGIALLIAISVIAVPAGWLFGRRTTATGYLGTTACYSAAGAAVFVTVVGIAMSFVYGMYLMMGA